MRINDPNLNLVNAKLSVLAPYSDTFQASKIFKVMCNGVDYTNSYTLANNTLTITGVTIANDVQLVIENL